MQFSSKHFQETGILEMKIYQVSRNFKRCAADLRKGDPDELVMMIDVDRCLACGSCQIACRMEHGRNAPLAISLGKNPCDGSRPSAGPQVLALPSSCRFCASPCEYRNEYNFWTSCPDGRSPAESPEYCDSCSNRISEGYMPACATRCTMKCIYVGRAADVAFALGEKRLREMGDAEMNR